MSEKYSNEEIIQDIKRVSEEYCDGETPTNKEYREYGNIPASTVCRKFDSWNNAIDACNYEKTNVYLSKEDCIKSIQKVSEKFIGGEAPTYHEYQNYSEHSSNTINQKFGSWNEALRESGFDINRRDKVSDEELIKDINRVFNQYSEGHYPTLGDIDECGEFPKVTYRKHFGGWTEALIASGFENPYPSKWPLSGEEHPAWNEDCESQGYGPSWYKQRKKARERDDYSCRICGDGKEELSRNPAVHHIRPKYMWNVQEEHEEMNSLDNLVTLCYSHHQLLEGEYKNLSTEEFVDRAFEEYE